MNLAVSKAAQEFRTFWTLDVSDLEMVEADVDFSAVSSLLADDSIADCLLGLSLIARKVERQQAQKELC